MLFNHSENDFKVNLGDRIAQLIIEKITDTTVQEVDTLDNTVRGAGGFGSTGVAGTVQHNPAPVNNNGNCKKNIYVWSF